MNVLVVGGAGYIGSHMVRTLDRAGHGVTILDNLSVGHRNAVTAGEFIRGDIANQELVESILAEKKIDAVMHFAASALVAESVADPAKYFQNNTLGSFNLLQAMRTVGVTRIVFSSTCATYGIPDRTPITESTLQLPVNPYGDSKLSVEKMLDAFCYAYQFSSCALRYFNAAGASPDGDIGEDHTPESHLIPIVLQVALGKRDHVTIFGSDWPTRDGSCVRDFIHVDDLGNAHLLALEKLSPGISMKLNLGTGQGFSVREIIAACREVTGHPIPAIEGDRRPGDPPELVADASLAKKVLGWQPKYPDAKTIIKTAWNWHQRYPDGYAE
ncbi:MAG: UDP-glucose 4-epimerase GalE [Planctomycetota bacterium]